MTITLYYTLDEPNKLEKKLNEIQSYTGALRNESSTLNLTIRIQTEDVDNIQKANYLHCEELHRYYFIKDRKAIRTGLFELSCTEDPLMSFKTQILGCRGIVSRNANIEDYYISDERDVQYQNPNIIYRNLVDSSGNTVALDKTSVLLITMGG